MKHPILQKSTLQRLIKNIIRNNDIHIIILYDRGLANPAINGQLLIKSLETEPTSVSMCLCGMCVSVSKLVERSNFYQNPGLNPVLLFVKNWLGFGLYSFRTSALKIREKLNFHMGRYIVRLKLMSWNFTLLFVLIN